MGRIVAVMVKPNAKKAGVAQLADGTYRIAVIAPARDGKANEAVIELVARHLRVPKSRVKIIRGFSSRHKLLEVTN
jgi:uncharacterized protein (TIGR00251 family)